MTDPLKILMPVDFSSHSLATLDFALSLTNFVAASYVLLYVVVSGEVETFASLGGEPEETLARHKEEAAARLAEEIERRRLEKPEIQIESRVVSGVPFKEICRIADEESFHLIVIGTHGRTGLSHLLIGSTAERVVQHASCPVLSIKPGVL
jgi:nucleotide-binding universal stress UspA family protein